MTGTERASPFTILEPTWAFATGPAPESIPSRSVSVSELIHSLVQFAEVYEHDEDRVRQSQGHTKREAIVARECNAGRLKKNIEAISGIDRLRSYSLSRYGAELTISTAQRFLGDLIRECALQLSVAAQLSVDDAMNQLEAATGQSRRDHLGGTQNTLAGTQSHSTTTQGAKPRQQTRGARRPAKEKLIAALTAHHQYQNGSCLCLEPVGNNELAKRANVSPSTTSEFFQSEFQGHEGYVRICADKGRLIGALRLLNGEVTPRLLLGDADAQVPSREEDED